MDDEKEGWVVGKGGWMVREKRVDGKEEWMMRRRGGW